MSAYPNVRATTQVANLADFLGKPVVVHLFTS